MATVDDDQISTVGESEVGTLASDFGAEDFDVNDEDPEEHRSPASRNDLPALFWRTFSFFFVAHRLCVFSLENPLSGPCDPFQRPCGAVQKSRLIMASVNNGVPSLG